MATHPYPSLKGDESSYDYEASEANDTPEKKRLPQFTDE
jgi:hypothetical protein